MTESVQTTMTNDKTLVVWLQRHHQKYRSRRILKQVNSYGLKQTENLNEYQREARGTGQPA